MASEEAALETLLAEDAVFSSFWLELLAVLDAGLEEAALLADSSCLVDSALADASLDTAEAAASLSAAAESASAEEAVLSGSASAELLMASEEAVGRKTSPAAGVPRRVYC